MARTVIVTGAASGIGRALAENHFERGDHVYALDWNGDALRDLAAKGIETRRIDVADYAALEATAAEIWEACDGVDWVYANAGVSAGGALLKTTPEAFERCFSINVIGAWATLQVFARRMAESGRAGRLCITGSEHSLGFQHAGAGVYTASKHAVLGMADVWRHELPSTISISVLCPGLTATGIGETPGASEKANAMGRAVMAEGLDPAIVAQATIEGVDRGDFLIASHSASKLGWDKRFADVDAAFERVPEAGRDIDRYAVPAAIQRAREKLTGGPSG